MSVKPPVDDDLAGPPVHPSTSQMKREDSTTAKLIDRYTNLTQSEILTAVQRNLLPIIQGQSTKSSDAKLFENYTNEGDTKYTFRSACDSSTKGELYRMLAQASADPTTVSGDYWTESLLRDPILTQIFASLAELHGAETGFGVDPSTHRVDDLESAVSVLNRCYLDRVNDMNTFNATVILSWYAFSALASVYSVFKAALQ